jgi:hypothetical protein
VLLWRRLLGREALTWTAHPVGHGVGGSAHQEGADRTLTGAREGSETVSAAVFEASTHVGGAISIATYAALLATDAFALAYVAAAVMALGGAASVLLLQAARRAEPLTLGAGTEPPREKCSGTHRR